MNSDSPKKLFCFGYGYSCDYLGHELSANHTNFSFSGTTRSPEKLEALKERGIEAYLYDKDTALPDLGFLLQNVTHLLISTPPDDGGDPVFLSYANEIKSLKNLEWVGYLSTTGVYGNRNGDWVDESAELRPTSKRGSRRVKAEQQWLSLLKSDHLPVHIFRLAGIYGPGRCALDTVRAGVARRINKPGHMFGRIHVEDIANILIKSMNNSSPGEVYNVCDGQPVASHKVIEYACEILGRPAPPMVDFDEADLAPITRSFYMDNRKVKNDKIINELGITLKHKNYKTGLDACLSAEKAAIDKFKSENPVNPFAKFQS